jgi:8-oxo-dGTP pyrophosphatase MutT (NUDIX family)
MKEYASNILSASITHPERLGHTRQGIALLIFNARHEILLVQQAHDDNAYDRRAGQWNIVTETREPGEYVKETARRAIVEELGSSLSQFYVIDGSYRETNGIYRSRVGYDFHFRCAELIYRGDPTVDPNQVFHSHDNEITHYAWVSPHTLRDYDIETGARLVLAAYGVSEETPIRG